MSSDGFTIFDTSIIQSIHNLPAVGLYCFLKSIGGKSTIENLKIHTKSSNGELKRSIKYLLDNELIDLYQHKAIPTLEYMNEDLIIIK